MLGHKVDSIEQLRYVKDSFPFHQNSGFGFLRHTAIASESILSEYVCSISMTIPPVLNFFKDSNKKM